MTDPLADFKRDMLDEGGSLPVSAEIEAALSEDLTDTSSAGLDGTLRTLIKRARSATGGSHSARTQAGLWVGRALHALMMRRDLRAEVRDPLASPPPGLLRGAPPQLTVLKEAHDRLAPIPQGDAKE